MNTKEQVLQMFSQLAKKPVSEHNTIKELNIDSLDLTMLIVDAEEKFNIVIPDEELLKLKTVADVIFLVENLRNNI